jgi:2-keto-4-pentenoate hydratase
MRLSIFINSLILVLLSATSQANETAVPEPAVLAARLMEAADERRAFPELAREYPALDDSMLFTIQDLFVQDVVAAGAKIGGFKGGFIPVASVGGVLFEGGFLDSPAQLDTKDFFALLIEAEIGFEFCEAVTAPLADVAALRAKVCRLRPAVELPDAALADLEAMKTDLPRLRRALIPPNMATRNVLLGAPVPADSVDVNTLPVRTLRNGELIGERKPGAPVPDLWESVRWIVNAHALARGYTIAAGHIVIPGNLTGLHAGTPGQYDVDYGPLGKVRVDVR